MEPVDSKFFSQRAKHISLLNEQAPKVKPTVASSSSETYFQFSNRTYTPKTDTQAASVGRGHGSSVAHDHRPSISTGRGRTTVPSSAFILQKDNRSPVTKTNIVSPPIFVMHDEVQFVRPYFGPRAKSEVSLLTQKREVLLSALKEIESDLKTL